MPQEQRSVGLGSRVYEKNSDLLMSSVSNLKRALDIESMDDYKSEVLPRSINGKTAVVVSKSGVVSHDFLNILYLDNLGEMVKVDILSDMSSLLKTSLVFSKIEKINDQNFKFYSSFGTIEISGGKLEQLSGVYKSVKDLYLSIYKTMRSSDIVVIMENEA